MIGGHGLTAMACKGSNYFSFTKIFLFFTPKKVIKAYLLNCADPYSIIT